MSPDTIFGMYVYCANWHSGQGSRLYRLLSRISTQYRPQLSDTAWKAIRKGIGPGKDEWSDANAVYRRLKRSRFGQ